MFKCIGNSALHDLPAPRVHVPAASDFYLHPYGGIGRDIQVTKEQFARFWELDDYTVERIPPNTKWFDVLHEKTEILGYRLVTWSFGQKTSTYRITIIDRGIEAKLKFHNQEVRRFGGAAVLSEAAIRRAVAEHN